MFLSEYCPILLSRLFVWQLCILENFAELLACSTWTHRYCCCCVCRLFNSLKAVKWRCFLLSLLLFLYVLKAVIDFNIDKPTATPFGKIIYRIRMTNAIVTKVLKNDRLLWSKALLLNVLICILLILFNSVICCLINMSLLLVRLLFLSLSKDMRKFLFLCIKSFNWFF